VRRSGRRGGARRCTVRSWAKCAISRWGTSAVSCFFGSVRTCVLVAQRQSETESVGAGKRLALHMLPVCVCSTQCRGRWVLHVGMIPHGARTTEACDSSRGGSGRDQTRVSARRQSPSMGALLVWEPRACVIPAGVSSHG
jgi:hypothetical protein